MNSFIEIKIIGLLVLLILALVVAVSAKYFRLPYVVSLVLVGLSLGAFSKNLPIKLEYDYVTLFCLPALIFDAAWNMKITDFFKNIRPIIALAFLGVFITLIFSVFILYFCAKTALEVALLFGAIIAATDPIAVLALFKKTAINPNVITVLEGESLFNDGISVVVYSVILSAILNNRFHDFNFLNLAINFTAVILGGVAIGFSVGYLATRLKILLNDHLLAITMSIVLAYGSFVIADLLKVSTIIASIVACLTFANFGGKKNMSLRTQAGIDGFWELAAFLVNSLLFLLIGFQINVQLLPMHTKPIIFGILAILLARLVLVYALDFIYQAKQNKLSLSEKHLIFWAALRGGLSMVLALNIPVTFTYRREIILITYGVVLFSLLAPGLSMKALVKKLNLI